MTLSGLELIYMSGLKHTLLYVSLNVCPIRRFNGSHLLLISTSIMVSIVFLQYSLPVYIYVEYMLKSINLFILPSSSFEYFLNDRG